MIEYIDREALLQDIEDSVCFTAKTGTISPEMRGANKVIDRINCAPAADVEPVRHGRWVMTLYATTSKRGRIISNRKFACSECGYSNGRKQNNYCPNCWAKMDEVSE